jgi:hypothetical protein
MGKFSQKMMGKEVGNAAVYAAPHTMDGKKFGAEVAAASQGYKTDPNTMTSGESTPGGMPARRVSMGNPARDAVKTTGIKMRGTGAATKGTMSRGPMG